MSSLLKSTVLSLGLLAGVAASAHAQSVSALPPTSSATAPTATTTPHSSSKIVPNPGGGSTWQEEHYTPQADYNADPWQHPYSTSVGPKPGSHTSGAEPGYKATDADKDRTRHPYTSTDVGPRPH